eukprot:CAMPEP_0201477450 /NCGR_PEP_ID=MMETSP0151_2-20130828/2469_1 /ASSEMBLY_ACC=CAM_ASM_000257 /TAXON_ID=200890 /ORGANISM="Paramoeba atlantica, Strain 621/1 / CCAP 1560/9" /LENGTH=303 /DNA_ID=CAMNT_0047858171 /DNA_START=227 /DNA_END=1138 /DNA_ORIENTATION=-
MTQNLNGYNLWNSFQQENISSFLKEKVSQRQSFILSSEFFAFFETKEILMLKELLVGFDVTIVAFHREKTSQVRSIWSEYNKLIQTPKDFNTWAASYFTDFKTKPWSLEKLDLFANTFGHDSIRLVSFEGSLAHSNPFFVLMNELMGLPLESLALHSERNYPSPSSFLNHYLVTASKISTELCTTPDQLNTNEEYFNVTERLQSLPQTCTQLTAWQQLFDVYDQRIFQKYGIPLYLPEKQSAPSIICQLDLLAIMSDLPKLNLLLSTIPKVCKGLEKPRNSAEERRKKELEEKEARLALRKKS